MAWQDDYYPGGADYPHAGEDDLDPWADPAYERAEDAE